MGAGARPHHGPGSALPVGPQTWSGKAGRLQGRARLRGSPVQGEPREERQSDPTKERQGDPRKERQGWGALWEELSWALPCSTGPVCLGQEGPRGPRTTETGPAERADAPVHAAHRPEPPGAASEAGSPLCTCPGPGPTGSSGDPRRSWDPTQLCVTLGKSVSTGLRCLPCDGGISPPTLQSP